MGYETLLSSKFLRFLVIGGLNTILNYSIYVLLIYIGFGYAFATTISFIIGLVVNFKTQGRFVFNYKSNRPFLLYVVSWIGIYVINLGVLGWLVVKGIDSYLAGALLIPPIAILSFFILKFVVFRERDSVIL